MDPNGKAAVVVGGASGIGRATALELARRGADVFVADLHEARAAEVVREVEALGRRAFALRTDVRSDADVDALRDAALGALGRVDLLVNSPGVSLLGAVEEIPIEDWQWVLDVNLVGFVRTCRAFLPPMLARGSGWIANVASIAGLYAYSYDAVPYVTSKFGCAGFTEGLAVYARPRGVGVSLLCPGLVQTNLAENARIVGVPDPASFLHFPEHMRRAIAPEEAAAVLCDGIEAERFLLLTHPEDEAVLRDRRADVDAAIARQVRESPDPFAGRYGPPERG
ncbi:MAG: SDR family NAD(P)-dependent oxidoreductase [Myxococcales bacterium]|nr:SDR family NAD(P)-dependent oxidoreductase [Myxococcales bacterium]